MSTEIKPGQVWAWSPSIDADESQFRIMTVDANRVRYEYLRESDPHIEGGFIHTPATIREQCRLVTDVDATPAPLDPSAEDALAASLQRLGKVWGEYQDQQMQRAAKALDTVAASIQQVVDAAKVAHQPAPEPEPEWKPGTLVSAIIWAGAKSKDEKHDVRLVRASNEEFPWYDPQEDDFYKDDVLTDVRPLVVLDPESDTDRLSNIIREVDGNHDLGAGGLAEAILQRLAR